MIPDQKIRRLRAGWLRRYREADISLAQLHRVAPLVGEAVEELLDAEPEALTDDLLTYRNRLAAKRAEAGGSIP